jgi:hypothetical protein
LSRILTAPQHKQSNVLESISPNTWVDGAMAYFGWPEAHEKEAERAARAGPDYSNVSLRLTEMPAPTG